MTTTTKDRPTGKPMRRSPTFIPYETSKEKVIRLYGKDAICPTCLNSFVSIPSPRNHTMYRTYCSNECYYNHKRAHKPTKQQARAQRICELEAEVGVLTRALEDRQMIFHIGEN